MRVRRATAGRRRWRNAQHRECPSRRQGVPEQTTGSARADDSKCPGRRAQHRECPSRRQGVPERRKVKIMSMGALKPGLLRGGGQLPDFENAQGKLHNVARGKGRGKGRGPPTIAPELVEDVVRRARPFHDPDVELAGPRDRVVVVDARPFHDPDVDSHDHYHIGLQPKTVEAVVRHDAFPKILRATLVDIKSAMEAVTEDGAILVVVYCRKGVHRSVSFAYILRKLLLLQSTQLGMEVLETYHASARVLWAREYCNECRDCRMHSARRDAAIEKARTVWQQVNPFTD